MLLYECCFKLINIYQKKKLCSNNNNNNPNKNIQKKIIFSLVLKIIPCGAHTIFLRQKKIKTLKEQVQIFWNCLLGIGAPYNGCETFNSVEFRMKNYFVVIICLNRTNVAGIKLARKSDAICDLILL